MPTQSVDKFASPLYTKAEAARFLGLPVATFRSWSQGYRVTREGKTLTAEPVVTSVGAGRRDATIPFIGLAEAYVLAALRRVGIPLQRIRPALAKLSSEIGVAHALASKQLFTDGAEVLYDYSSQAADDVAEPIRELVVVRNGQHVLNEAVQQYLRRIEFGTDGYAMVVPLPGFRRASVIADARRSFGQPIFVRGGARLSDAFSMFRGGEDLDVVAEEYGIPREELEDAVRQAFQSAA